MNQHTIPRRKFLAASISALGLAPMTWLRAQPSSPNDEITIGVIGHGAMGSGNMIHFLNMPGASQTPAPRRTNHTMTTHIFIAAAWLTGCGISAAVEGISSDWTQVAAADLSLMGDYQGEWVDAPTGHYFCRS